MCNCYRCSEGCTCKCHQAKAAELSDKIQPGQTFYMVYVEGSNTPTVKHATVSGAMAQAKALSHKLQKRAYILTATSTCVPVANVVWEEMR